MTVSSTLIHAGPVSATIGSGMAFGGWLVRAIYDAVGFYVALAAGIVFHFSHLMVTARWCGASVALPLRSSIRLEAIVDDPVKIIAVVRGARNMEIQSIFRTLADVWRPEIRLAGVVAEDHGLPDRACQAGFLRSLSNGARFSIFHDLGPGVAQCHLDGIGAVAAADSVLGDIAAGCDLVLLNKFGKLEIAGDGLAGAFRAAITAGLPLLTSVSPAHDEAWRRFVDQEFAVLPPDPAAIDLWRHTAQTQIRRALA